MAVRHRRFAPHHSSPAAPAGEFMPAGQSTQLNEPKIISPYLPLGQSAHWLLPTPLENFPGGHSVQTEAPVSEYLPITQGMQVV